MKCVCVWSAVCARVWSVSECLRSVVCVYVCLEYGVCVCVCVCVRPECE